MPTIDETIEFIKQAHTGQTDKAGNPYYLHPVAVMGNLPAGVSEDVKHAALLHDVIEDTHFTRADLEARGYSKETLDIVELVTNSDPDLPYPAKIRKIIHSGNEGAILVKWADMTENTNPDRLAELPAEKAAYFRAKYGQPYRELTEAVTRLGYDVGNNAELRMI